MREKKNKNISIVTMNDLLAASMLCTEDDARVCFFMAALQLWDQFRSNRSKLPALVFACDIHSPVNKFVSKFWIAPLQQQKLHDFDLV